MTTRLGRGLPTSTREISGLELFKESLPLHRHYPMSPWITKSLAHLLIAYAACERWGVAARLAGVLGSGANEQIAAPAELSGRAASAFVRAIRTTHEALGTHRFDDEASAGAAMTREAAMQFALSG